VNAVEKCEELKHSLTPNRHPEGTRPSALGEGSVTPSAVAMQALTG
jgi:hypothetical protein